MDGYIQITDRVGKVADKETIQGNVMSVPSTDFKMDYQPYKETCIVCKRRILVELHQFGVSHVGGLAAICAECLPKSPYWERFSKEHPEIAKDLLDWSNEGSSVIGT